jgi:PPOX class probable F420-dependent enzyme
MRTMSEQEWRAFVSEGTRTGKAGVTRADGSPHVTPIWFLLDGDDVVFTTGRTSIKGRVLRTDPRLSICVDVQEPAYHYVMLTAEASISEDLEDVLRWATALGGRYMGPGRGEEYGRRNAVPGEVLVRARITKVVAYRDIAS